MSAPRELNIALAGLGTVGSGVVRLLQENQQELSSRGGCRMILKKVAVRDLHKGREVPLPAGAVLTTDVRSLADDPSIDVVVELMGGQDTAHELIERAVRHGRQVVTANKALLAHSGPELFELASRHGVSIRYEASVAGGIPIVQALRESLAGNRIASIMGILNGTGNYILTEMTNQGSSFEQALAEAQAKGFAEADPTLDIDGHDTAHKLVLLIRLAWGVDYPYALLPVYGIRAMHGMDIEFAREFGCRIKLLGQARMVDGKIEAGVFPTLVNHTYLLAQVGGAFNAVRVEGNAVGPLFLHGQGAGSLPTASAVLADLVAVARDKLVNSTCFVPQRPHKAMIYSPDEAQSAWYLRFTVRDCSGVLRDLTGALADQDVSIAQAIQKSGQQGGVPLVFKTHTASTKAIRQAVDAMQQNNLLLAPAVCYRILE